MVSYLELIQPLFSTVLFIAELKDTEHFYLPEMQPINLINKPAIYFIGDTT